MISGNKLWWFSGVRDRGSRFERLGDIAMNSCSPSSRFVEENTNNQGESSTEQLFTRVRGLKSKLLFLDSCVVHFPRSIDNFSRCGDVVVRSGSVGAQWWCEMKYA